MSQSDAHVIAARAIASTRSGVKGSGRAAFGDRVLFAALTEPASGLLPCGLRPHLARARQQRPTSIGCGSRPLHRCRFDSEVACGASFPILPSGREGAALSPQQGRPAGLPFLLPFSPSRGRPNPVQHRWQERHVFPCHLPLEEEITVAVSPVYFLSRYDGRCDFG